MSDTFAVGQKVWLVIPKFSNMTFGGWTANRCRVISSDAVTVCVRYLEVPQFYPVSDVFASLEEAVRCMDELPPMTFEEAMMKYREDRT